MLDPIKKALADSSGFTLVEVLMAVSIMLVTVGLVGAGLFQVINVRRFWADDALATRDLRQAGAWFSGDALNADKALVAPGGDSLAEDCTTPPSTPVTAVTLTWTDLAGVAKEATYSVTGGALNRTDEADNQIPIVIDGVVDQSIKIYLCKSLLTLELDVDADRGTTETMRLSTYLRKMSQ